MTIQVLMPQLGESVIEGTVAKWLIAVGQTVQEAEPLLQITTDKVDTELPAPASGILLEILVAEGQTVPKGTVLAVIGAQGSGTRDQESGVRSQESEPVDTAPLGFISPVVGRLAAELDVDLAQVIGTGAGGRITKKDVLAYVAAPTPREPFPVTESLVPSHPSAQEAQLTDSQIIPLSPMRLAIAHHMTLSVQTAPQVTTVMEADMKRVVARASGCAANSSARASD